ncbi:hypothetical protein LX97_02665 [Nonlabens dokdonensis]|uniref:Uncharacterized protein n=2 Tax=Nonlabens dokdonensis TaxID=328515 RepID=L7WA66_NONDD|nr:hypothetical protein [Nonlabens dokdonensis]AGC78570.1 hypothetical protein DDD_3443 [Nonlabens dokdonensis DSW-6]PZX39299.1 hypothetical protein LX97_02665 [Nonlabens dokdonensis]
MEKKHQPIKNLLLILLFAICMSVTAQNESSKTCNVLPSEINSEIYFGIDLAEFKKIVGNNLKLETKSNTNFRLIYSQKTNLPEIPMITYYFDNKENKPLYEIILNYQNEKQAQNAATLLFGQPNYNQTEWRTNIQGFPNIWSWVYKNKLVVVAKIPGSEWFDEWDKK